MPQAPALTPRAERVLAAAATEAERLGHTHIGTEHLLLGLLTEPNGIAAQELAGFGIVDRASGELAHLMKSPGYMTSSDIVVNKAGEMLGHMAIDPNGNPHVVDDLGRRVTLVWDQERGTVSAAAGE